MASELSVGKCEHCQGQFGYYLIHSGSITQFTPTVTLAGKLPYCRSGTSECQTCRTARLMRRFVQRWSRTSARATAVAVLYVARHHAARFVTNRCLPYRRPHTSRAMRQLPRKAGAGKEVGAVFTVSSSKTRWLRTTSDRCCSSWLFKNPHLTY